MCRSKPIKQLQPLSQPWILDSPQSPQALADLSPNHNSTVGIGVVPISSLSYLPFLQTPRPISMFGDAKKVSKSSHPSGNLDLTDVELLRHYLLHTSLCIPFDRDDLYALRIGIPNLAFQSPPLMSSILALSAVCKAHDLAKQRRQGRRGDVLDLLSLADKHHRASLLQVQQDLSDPSQYDYILANATLMVLYASASHCVRIHLTGAEAGAEPTPLEFLPVQSQWISLIRAAHLAFVGLSNDKSRRNEIELKELGTSLNIPTTTSPSTFMDVIISPEDGPTKMTKDLLFPILAKSSIPALKALRARASAILKTETHVETLTRSTKSATFPICSGSSAASLQACFTSLDILDGIVSEVFSAPDFPSPTISDPNHAHSACDSGRHSTVLVWLRSYVARVTSSEISNRPLRRVIMAFLNRVPAEFLGLVQTILDSIDIPISQDEQRSWRSSNSEFSNPSAAQKLAIDVFAHWLVLVMLLDGVWWIGGIGAWELSRVISFLRAQSWCDSNLKSGEYWWPESMYRVSKELRKL